jgi:hypothetical protein
LGCALAFTIGIALLYVREASARRTIVLGVLVSANAVFLFSIPPLAGLKASKLDIELVTFLQQRLGLERFYTLAPFSPNYGAYYRVASINHNAVPIPLDWIRFIDSTLDPHAVTNTSSLFIGYFPGPFGDREKALRTHLEGFEATAVKYVLTPLGANPFTEQSTRQDRDKPKLVYHGEVADVFELPHFVNYFEAQGGPCDIFAHTREFVHALCKAPAVLVRRELFYPGWHAFVNGRESQLMRSTSIFQVVNLPGGRSNISFSYQPSHIGWAYTAAIFGLILLLSGAVRVPIPFIRNLYPAGSSRRETYSIS